MTLKAFFPPISLSTGSGGSSGSGATVLPCYQLAPLGMKKSDRPSLDVMDSKATFRNVWTPFTAGDVK